MAQVETVIEEAEAWQEYLEEIRGTDRARYEEVEPWAWMRLQKRLLTIFKKKPK